MWTLQSIHQIFPQLLAAPGRWQRLSPPAGDDALPVYLVGLGLSSDAGLAFQLSDPCLKAVFALLSYPLLNQHNYGESQFLKGKPSINGHFQ